MAVEIIESFVLPPVGRALNQLGPGFGDRVRQRFRNGAGWITLAFGEGIPWEKEAEIDALIVAPVNKEPLPETYDSAQR